VHVTYSRDSILLWRRSDKLRVLLVSFTQRQVRGNVAVSAFACGVRGRRFDSHHGRLCLLRRPPRYAALGTGCAPVSRSTQPNIPPGSLTRLPPSAELKGGNITYAGCQVTLCDPTRVDHGSLFSGPDPTRIYNALIT